MRSGRSEANAFQQWYQRRKLDALCYVGHKFEDPVGHEESCPCTDDDYEWSVGIPFVNAPSAHCAYSDFNYVRQDGDCVAAGPEAVPAGTCNRKDDQYLGSSGYRLIPGNACDQTTGVVKDKPYIKDCSSARPEDGRASHVVVGNQEYSIVASSLSAARI